MGYESTDIIALSKALNVSCDWLLTGEEYENRKYINKLGLSNAVVDALRMVNIYSVVETSPGHYADVPGSEQVVPPPVAVAINALYEINAQFLICDLADYLTSDYTLTDEQIMRIGTSFIDVCGRNVRWPVNKVFLEDMYKQRLIEHINDIKRQCGGHQNGKKVKR